MPSFVRLLDRIAQIFAWIACLFCFVMMVHVTADVTGRTFFNYPLIGTLEIVSAYYMTLLAFLPLAWVTRQREHIFVELFTSRMSFRNTLRLDVFVALLTLFYVSLFGWQAAIMAIEKTEIGESWEAATGYIPVWQSRWVLVTGLASMAIFVLLQILKDIAVLRSGRNQRETGEPMGRAG